MTDSDRIIARNTTYRTLQDINTLRKTEAFSTYFLARLGQKRKALEIAFRTEPADKCSMYRREELRQQLLLLDELLAMMDVDERAATSTYERLS